MADARIKNLGRDREQPTYRECDDANCLGSSASDTNVTVSWGFKLNSTVKVGDPLNTGSRIDPIPGLDLSLEWSMSSILKKQQGVDQFFVRGDGVTDHVNLY